MKPMGDGHGSIGLLQALFFFVVSGNLELTLSNGDMGGKI